MDLTAVFVAIDDFCQWFEHTMRRLLLEPDSPPTLTFVRATSLPHEQRNYDPDYLFQQSGYRTSRTIIVGMWLAIFVGSSLVCLRITASLN